jgi:hypothetical protein
VTDADDIQDARLDQIAYQLVADYGNVHAGFYEIYSALSPQILPILTGLTKVARFFFTGHTQSRRRSFVACRARRDRQHGAKANGWTTAAALQFRQPSRG